MNRRGFIATIGATALAGCSTRADSGGSSTPTGSATATTTASPTTTTATTTEFRPTTVTEVSLPERVVVDDPLSVEVEATNPDGEKARLVWGVTVTDAAASKRWVRSYDLKFEDGQTDLRRTFEIDWGTHHETTLLVKPGGGSLLLAGKAPEVMDLRRVEVVSA